VQIGTYSCGISVEGKPGDAGVKVFLEPVDQFGSTLKAAGDVKVEIYDLATPPPQNLLHTCRYSVDEIGGKWINGFLTQYFVFECLWGQNIPQHRDLTVRVVFTDYLTGNEFSDQKVIQVTLPPTSQPASAPATSVAPASAPAPATSSASAPATQSATSLPATNPNP
jgi:hypothetical protein